MRLAKIRINLRISGATRPIEGKAKCALVRLGATGVSGSCLHSGSFQVASKLLFDMLAALPQSHVYCRSTALDSCGKRAHQ
jgi:hypothetical protein